MIITDKAVFLQLPKCASTSLQRVIKGKFGGVQYGKHSRLEIAPVTETAGKPVVGGVRNPFAWYLSLWKFGCSQRGINWICATTEKKAGNLPDAAINRLQHTDAPKTELLLSKHLTCEKMRDPALWQQLYSAPDDIAAFRDWLSLIHQSENRFFCFPEFGYTQYYQNTGLYSHVFLQLYLQDNADVYGKTVNFETATFSPDILIRQESFVNDVLQALVDTNHAVEPDLETTMASSEKVNSTGGAKQLSEFYDAESRALIEQKDGDFIRATQTSLSTLFYGPLQVTAPPQSQ